MPRVLLVLYLTASTLAGPRVCPCPTPAAGAALPGTAVPAGADTAPRPCGCRADHGRPTADASRSARDSRPDRPPAPGRCQCGKPDATAVVRGAGRVAKPSADHPLVADPASAFGGSGLVPAADAPGAGRGRDLPFHSADVLLHVFHRLRC